MEIEYELPDINPEVLELFNTEISVDPIESDIGKEMSIDIE